MENLFGAQIWAKGTKIGLSYFFPIFFPVPFLCFFSYFIKFGSLVFLQIVCNDRLQQCITSRRDKSHTKVFGTKSGPRQAKIELETRFSAIFSSLVH